MRPRLRRWSCALFAAAGLHLAPAWAQPSPEPPLLVYAAASLTDVLGELSAAWQRRPDIAIRSSFASSAVLARQIEAGGRADVFIAADQEWMDYLQARGLVDPATRRDVAGTRLVLIAPAASPLRLRIAPRFDLAGALAGGRLSTADPDTVPAGRYARAALASLGVWHQVETRLARADNVRGALMFVARGEAPLGIVYATDARADRKVRIVDLFPADTHAPIAYPAAALAGARREAADYVQFLAGAEARAIWKKHGFTEIE
jgi:molybdate transport system substrate-binding protein